MIASPVIESLLETNDLLQALLEGRGGRGLELALGVARRGGTWRAVAEVLTARKSRWVLDGETVEVPWLLEPAARGYVLDVTRPAPPGTVELASVEEFERLSYERGGSPEVPDERRPPGPPSSHRVIHIKRRTTVVDGSGRDTVDTVPPYEPPHRRQQ